MSESKDIYECPIIETLMDSEKKAEEYLNNKL